MFEIGPAQRARRWREDCDYGRKHQLDSNMQRQVWSDGAMRDLILCSWCGSWVAADKVEEDMLSSWTADAKRYWRSKHPR
jgi:hypothetical protein